MAAAVRLGRSGGLGLRLPVFDEGLQIRFESRPVLAGMLEQQFDQPPFAGAEMPVHASPGQTVQQGDGLLGQ